MNKPWRTLKTWITAALAVLFIVDLGLVYITWRSSPEAVAAMREQRDKLEDQAKKLKGDVARGDRIRNSLGQAQKDYDTFYTGAFLSPKDGYSSIETDLTTLASKAGLHPAGIQFQQKEVKGHDVTDVLISETIEGDYPAIIQFINGLERSKYFYLLKDLRLDSASSGGIRLQLELHTYFRT
jgi:hypothetical protein